MKGSGILWTSKEAAAAVGTETSGKWEATGVSIDSRTVKPGDLFIGIKGENSDGHKYVADAIQKGAVAAIVSEKIEGVKTESLLTVSDTQAAMEALGKAARARTSATIIGITGSVGKTGTKELLAAAFGALGQAHASVKSYNNHWGVPYSLSTMHPGSDYAIFEMGMNHANEIRPLTKQVRPHIAIITTIAAVHAGNFENGVEGVAYAKAEIFEGVESGGTAILPHDNEWFSFLKEKAEALNLKVKSFGENESADATIENCIEAANGTRVRARIMGETVEYTLQIPGRHIAVNSLAALLAVKVAGGDVQKAAKALGKQEPIQGRGKREYIDIGDKNNPVTLIDESYNASPAAMKAAFKVLAMIDPGRGGRRIAVLGDMYELGPDAAKHHAELAMPLEAAGVQLLYTSGPLMKNLYNAVPAAKRGAHHDDSRELAKIVPDVLVPGDVVLVKGSRGGGEKPRMQLVVEALRELPGKAARKQAGS
jgi:UDP-N-acetylmuramoyl-tripeptide--D-alanyl-D-alanine ligase